MALAELGHFELAIVTHIDADHIDGSLILFQDAALGLSLALALAGGCSTRGPVDRSVDAAHATNRTVGESVDQATESPRGTRNAQGNPLTSPRLCVRSGYSVFYD